MSGEQDRDALAPKRDLRTASELSDRHYGRTVTAGGLTGILVGLLPVADRVALRLVVGGQYAFTDWLDGGDVVEVERRTAG